MRIGNPFMQLDTTLIFHQLQGFYEKVLAEHTDWEAAKKSEVEAWFNTMKGQLTEDAAVNLQNQIFDLAAKSITLTNNLLATEAGKSALDAAVGPAIQRQIDGLNDNLVSNIYVGDDGKLHKVQGGADTALNFSSGIKPVYGSFRQPTALKTGNHYVTVNFGQTFPSVPTVYIQPTDSNSGNYNGIKCITSVTTTGFTFLYSIGSGGGYYPKLNWIAWV